MRPSSASRHRASCLLCRRDRERCCARRRGHIGHRALSSAEPCLSPGRGPPSWRLSRRDTGAMEALREAPRSSGASASSPSSSALSTRRGRVAARACFCRAMRASARRGSSPSWRGAHASRVRGPAPGAAIDFVGTELPYQPFVEALRPLGDARARSEPGVAAARVRGMLALLADARARRPCCSCSRTCTGRTHRPRPVRLPRPQPRRPRFCCSRPARADDPTTAAEDARARRGLRRTAPPSRSSSARSSPRSSSRCSPPARASSGGQIDAIVARAEGNPFFAEELFAAADEEGELPREPPRPSPAAGRAAWTSRHAEPAAVGRRPQDGRRTTDC